MRPDPIDWATWIIDGVAVVVSTGTAILFWYRRRGSRHWPTANGTVEYGFTSDASGWQTNLVYSYFATATSTPGRTRSKLRTKPKPMNWLAVANNRMS